MLSGCLVNFKLLNNRIGLRQNILKPDFINLYYSTKNKYKKNPEIIIEDSATANNFDNILFTPTKKIDFIDGKAEIYSYRSLFSELAHVVSNFSLGYIPWISILKIMNFSQLNMFESIFYPSLLLVGIRYLYKVHRNFTTVITSIKLDEDGQHIEYTTLLMGIKTPSKKASIQADIKKIDNPGAFDIVIQGLGVPISINNKIYVLPRYGKVFDEDTLTAIVQGICINTSIKVDKY